MPDDPNFLPAPDADGYYHYPDGSMIFPVRDGNPRLWGANWADGRTVRSSDDRMRCFDSPEEAAKALRRGGEGPTSLRGEDRRDDRTAALASKADELGCPGNLKLAAYVARLEAALTADWVGITDRLERLERLAAALREGEGTDG